MRPLEDDEVVSLEPEPEPSSRSGSLSTLQRGRLPLLDVGAGRFESLMLKEIHEQPASVRETTRSLKRSADARDEWLRRTATDVERVQLVACGTAYHAALAGRQFFESWTRLPCSVEVASEWRYRAPHGDERTLVVGISQSGETADTLGAIRHARAHDLRTLAVTNMAESQIVRDAETTLYTQAGLELSVAATKTFTAQVALLAAIAIELGGARGVLSDGERVDAETALAEVPERMAAFLAGSHPLDEVAEEVAGAGYVFFLGRRVGLPVALEGALKLREIAYIPCEAYPAAEMKHGPIALIDEGTPVIVVATGADAQEKIVSSIEEVRARGARVLAIARDVDEELQHHADDVVYVPATDPLLQPLIDVMALQLLGKDRPAARADPDRPRNLAKTVTVE